MASAVRIETGAQEARAELVARIAQIDRDFRLLSVAELCRRVDALRRVARLWRFDPVADLAGGLEDSLARSGRGALIRPYLDGMREALDADYAPGSAVGAAYLASVGVRLG